MSLHLLHLKNWPYQTEEEQWATSYTDFYFPWHSCQVGGKRWGQFVELTPLGNHFEKNWCCQIWVMGPLVEIKRAINIFTSWRLPRMENCTNKVCSSRCQITCRSCFTTDPGNVCCFLIHPIINHCQIIVWKPSCFISMLAVNPSFLLAKIWHNNHTFEKIWEFNS